MLGFRLAFSLLRIPRLFVSLLLFPLFLSVLLVICQLFLAGVLVQVVDQNPERLESRLNQMNNHSFVRQLIYGSSEKIKTLEICRWTPVTADDGRFLEIPPNDSCYPDRLDVAIHVSDPKNFNVAPYEEILHGNFERLHICQERCKPDIILTHSKDKIRTDTFSIPALLLLNRSFLDESVNEDYLRLANTRRSIIDRIGTQFLHADGYKEPIQLSAISLELTILGSIASIIVVGLWLAIKAHRKVLDYFARSGALLPMVAALGKKEFYSAIWMVTALRVAAFLLASIPSTYLLFEKLSENSEWAGIFRKDFGHFAIWLIALTASFTFAAIVASVADLKHRHNLFAIAYRYLPLILSMLGIVLWGFSFLFENGSGSFRNLITSLPIIGMGPVILGPLFQPSLNVLVAHTLLTAMLTLLLIRSNARWFAAHLEDL